MAWLWPLKDAGLPCSALQHALHTPLSPSWQDDLKCMGPHHGRGTTWGFAAFGHGSAATAACSSKGQHGAAHHPCNAGMATG